MVYLDVFCPSAGHWWFPDSMDGNITLYTHILIYCLVLTYLCTVLYSIYHYLYMYIYAHWCPSHIPATGKLAPICPATDCPVADLLQDDCQFCPDFSESLLLERLSHVPEDGRSGAFNSDIQVVMEYYLDVSKMYSYCNFLGHHLDCFFDRCFVKVKVLTDFFVHTWA